MKKSTSPELISALLGSIDCLRSFCKDLEGIESYDQQGVAASLEEIPKNYQELPQTLENPKLKWILNPPFIVKYLNQTNPDFPGF